MPRFLRIRSRLGALFEPQRVLFSMLLKVSFAKKAGVSAICTKREENSLAALLIVYLFFIIYQKSRVWTITRLKNLRDVYVERYLFSIFVVVKVPKLPINEYKIINQYRLTYALCGGLNHVNYLNIIKRDHVSATVRTRLHLASGWSLDHSGA